MWWIMSEGLLRWFLMQFEWLRASAHTTLQRLEDVTDENNTSTFNLFPHCTWDEDEIVDPLVDPSLF